MSPLWLRIAHDLQEAIVHKIDHVPTVHNVAIVRVKGPFVPRVK
jgi:hypothetical protein